MFLIASALGFALTTTQAQPTKMTPHRHTFGALALSPQATLLADVESDEAEDAVQDPHGAVVLRAPTGERVAVIDPCPTCVYRDPTFSANGKSLAFIGRDRAAGTATLFLVRDLATPATVVTLAQVAGVMQRPRFSPDDATLAVLAVEGAHKEVGATQAAAPQVGEIGESVDEQRIEIIPVTGGVLKPVTPGDRFIYEFGWTPDGKGFVATSAKGDGDANWWVADLIAVDAMSGAVRQVLQPKEQLNFPTASPDGTSIAFIGGLMSDFGAVGGDLFVAPYRGGLPRNLSEGFKGSFTSILWSKAGLFATALVSDKTELVKLDPNTGAMQVLWAEPISVSAGDAEVALDAQARHIAAVSQDFTHPAEISLGTVKTFGLAQRITHENALVSPIGAAQSLSWTNDGRTLQGWLLSPAGTPVSGKAPMVVIVHGGPSAAYQPTFPGGGLRGGTRRLLEHGYYVFLPNPRGSYGQGEAFTRANVRDFGGGDLSDILTGIDAVEKIAPVDDARLGMLGHSYGGFMTMWTVTHSHRFAAAVAGAGIANWISYYGENGIDAWMIPFFGASAYDDPAIYRKLSPLETIKAATTPTLIYVGERDVECPAPQSFEFWRGLKAVGVKTKLIVFDGEGHGIRKPEHLRQLNAAELDWFDTYLKSKP